MALLFSGKYRVCPDVISEVMLDETLLLNTQTLVYICLEKPGGDLWRLLEKHEDLETVFAAYAEQHPQSEENLEQVLNGCIGAFQRARLITLEQTSQPGNLSESGTPTG